MHYRPLLKSSQWADLIGIPSDEQALIRHYTLSGEDVDRALAKRGQRNQLGFAVQLCLMRFPGRVLGQGETPPSAVLAYVAQQIDVAPVVFTDYARRDETRREHALEIQHYLGLRSAGRQDRRAAILSAAAAASATDKGLPIAEAMVEQLRSRSVLLPSAVRLDRIGRAGRALARRRANAALLDGLPAAQLTAIDNLLARDPEIGQTRFGWLRACPEAPGADNLIALIERLDFVRRLGIDASRRGRIHPERWNQMVREGEVTPSWLAADFNAGRRRATIVAQLIALSEKLTDAAVTMFNKLIGRLFARALTTKKQRHADSRRETAQALRLFRDTLRALAMANETDANMFDVLDAEVGWHRLMRAKPTVEAMVLDADPEPLLVAVERYSSVRKYAPQFLSAFVICSSRRHDPLIAAIELLRSMNRTNRRSLSGKVPVGHLTDKARKLIFAAGKPDRRLYEIATLATLRDRLRSGDVSVEGSSAFQPFDEHLMPEPAFSEKKENDVLGLGVPVSAEVWLWQMRQLLDFRLKRLAYRARSGRLDGVRLVNGELVVSPLRGEVPPGADDLKWELNHLLPRIGITDLLAEVNSWTDFSASFTHLRTQEQVRSTPAILSAVLADATNLGAKRMAEASADVSERQIMWARLFHIRPETYKAAQAAITNAHTLHPHARLWGSGTTSSSDGQFFRAADRAAERSDTNRHYGSEPGSKFYSHLSDQYGYYSILPISAGESEAPYVLDGLFDHETILDIEEHFTDTGGASDHVFGLFALLGRRFAPRLRNLKTRQFHPIDRPDNYPVLKRHIGASINTALIREHWDDLLRISASMTERVVAPSTILKKLAASSKPSQLARALREVGRIERTLFMIEWYSDPALRRRCQSGLNKGEAAHKLKRAVYFHERGEIRDRSLDSQSFRASGLNLVVSAIIHWNTAYLDKAANHLKSRGRSIPDHLLRHVSPLTWEHINLTGIYSWTIEPPRPGELRPLRESGASVDWAA
jgi:TnpA family transposase